MGPPTPFRDSPNDLTKTEVCNRQGDSIHSPTSLTSKDRTTLVQVGLVHRGMSVAFSIKAFRCSIFLAQVFRSQQASVAPAEDAARFFSNASSASEFSAETPYNVYALRAALPVTQMPMAQPLPQQKNLSAWAADFSQHQQLLSPASQHLVQNNIEEAKQDLHYKGDAAIVRQRM